jgi:hypothetical protein
MTTREQDLEIALLAVWVLAWLFGIAYLACRVC